MNRSCFLVILAAYPILFIASTNAGQVVWQDVLAAAAVAIGTAMALALVASLVLRSWAKASLVVVVFVVLFFAYGPVHAWLLGTLGDEPGISGFLAENLHMLLTLAWLAVLAACVAGIRRVAEGRLPGLLRSLNVTAIILLAVTMAQFLATAFAERGDNGPSSSQVATPVSAAGPGSLPDIYYIVLDGYARADVLDSYYGYDNSAFIDGLRTRGFQVADASNANYFWTYLSLASALNLDYVQSGMGLELDPATTVRGAVYERIRDNRVARFLRERGYRIVHLNSTWGATLSNKYADEQIACRGGAFSNEFYRVVAEASWLKALQSRLSASLADCHLSNLDVLSRMGPQSGPKFVFAHILLPHHPYLFDRQGRVLRDAELGNQFEFQLQLWEEKDQYVDQLAFISERITEVVDRIVASSLRPPIIILQSDHGPNLKQGLTPVEQLTVRFANFAAYLLPGAPAGLMPADSAPVNQFRRVFNHYFEAGLPLLPERQFYSGYRSPYLFREVTGLGSADEILASRKGREIDAMPADERRAFSNQLETTVRLVDGTLD